MPLTPVNNLDSGLVARTKINNMFSELFGFTVTVTSDDVSNLSTVSGGSVTNALDTLLSTLNSYVLVADRGVANGIAELDGNSKLTNVQIPDKIISATSTASTQIFDDVLEITNPTASGIRELNLAHRIGNSGVEEKFNINTSVDTTGVQVLTKWQSLDNAGSALEDVLTYSNQTEEFTFLKDVNISGVTVKLDELYSPDGTKVLVFTDNADNVTIDGNLIQTGASYETHLEQLYTTKDYIFLRDGAVSGLGAGQYAGFEAVLYDGVNNGRLVFDNTGTARVGDVGSEQPLAVREEAPIDTGLAFWDTATTKFTTATSLADSYLSANIYRIATNDSGDVTEGTNLYYTEARVSANTDVDANTAYRGVGHIPLSEKSVANGVATLGANVRLPNAQTPEEIKDTAGTTFIKANADTLRLQPSTGGSVDITKNVLITSENDFELRTTAGLKLFITNLDFRLTQSDSTSLVQFDVFGNSRYSNWGDTTALRSHTSFYDFEGSSKARTVITRPASPNENDFTIAHSLWDGTNLSEYMKFSKVGAQLDFTTSKIKQSGVLEIDGVGDSYITGNLGVGTSTPDKQLHVYTGDSTATASPVAAMVVEDNLTSYVNFLTTNAGVQGLLFGDPESNSSGTFTYSHASNSFDVQANGATRLTIDSTGVDVTGDVKASGVLEIDGTGDSYVMERLGVGTITPAAYLHIVNNDGIGNESGLIVESDARGGFAAYVNNTYDESSSNGLLVNIKNTSISNTIQRWRANDVELIRIDGAGCLGINTTSPTAKLDINSDILRLRTAKTPSSASDTGNQGDIAWDSTYIYICVATDTWQRVQHATW